MHEAKVIKVIFTTLDGKGVLIQCHEEGRELTNDLANDKKSTETHENGTIRGHETMGHNVAIHHKGEGT